MKQRLRIQDIASLAGVSKATVSRVLNHHPTVDSVMRERVLKVVSEYGFTPHVGATMLGGGAPQFIGVLGASFGSPATAEIFRGVTDRIEQTSYKLILYNSATETERMQRNPDYIPSTDIIAGLLAILPGPLARSLAHLSQQGMPVVVIDDQVAPGVSLPWIGIDNHKSAYEATRHLLQMGYRRIGHVLGPEEYLCVQQRYAGYCQALRDAHLEPEARWLWRGNFRVHSGRACAESLASLPPDERPDALFCANDQMAFGVIERVRELGLHVPEDLAIVGFDDAPMTSYMKPGLTTVRQPHYELGRLAFELLLSLINPNVPFPQSEDTFHLHNQGNNWPLRIVIPTRLVVRETSRMKRAARLKHELLQEI